MEQLLHTLAGQNGRVSQALALIGSLRLALKPFNGLLLDWLHRVIGRLENNPDPYILGLALGLLHNRAYRLLAFLLDTAISLKLPTADSLEKHTLQAINNQVNQSPL